MEVTPKTRYSGEIAVSYTLTNAFRHLGAGSGFGECHRTA